MVHCLDDFLDAVLVVCALVVGHAIVLEEPSLVIAVIVLIGSLIEVAQAFRAANREVTLHTESAHFRVVSLGISDMSICDLMASQSSRVSSVLRVVVSLVNTIKSLSRMEHLIVVGGLGADVNLSRRGVDRRGIMGALLGGSMLDWLSTVLVVLHRNFVMDLRMVGSGKVSSDRLCTTDLMAAIRSISVVESSGRIRVSSNLVLSEGVRVMAIELGLSGRVVSMGTIAIGVGIPGTLVDTMASSFFVIPRVAMMHGSGLVWVVSMLEVAVMLLLKDIVVLVTLLGLLALSRGVLVCGLSLHWFHNGRLEVLTVVELLGHIRLHLEDEVAVVDVGLGGAESRRVGIKGSIVALVPPVGVESHEVIPPVEVEAVRLTVPRVRLNVVVEDVPGHGLGLEALAPGFERGRPEVHHDRLALVQ